MLPFSIPLITPRLALSLAGRLERKIFPMSERSCLVKQQQQNSIKPIVKAMGLYMFVRDLGGLNNREGVDIEGGYKRYRAR